MDKQKILKICDKIYHGFNGIENATGSFNNGHLNSLVERFIPFPDNDNEEQARLWFDHTYIAFSIGYAIGQLFDLPSENVDKLKRILREEKVLPYFPREKKAA